MLGQMTVNSAVCDISKIRNVVNSQRGRSLNSTPLCCLRYIKDTKCSQFTTKRAICKMVASAVCDISKIRNVVNSQLYNLHSLQCKGCLRYIKDTKCSQFTTKDRVCQHQLRCLRYIKDTKCSQFTTHSHS